MLLKFDCQICGETIIHTEAKNREDVLAWLLHEDNSEVWESEKPISTWCPMCGNGVVVTWLD